MPMLTWMADVLRDAGLPVREIPGWKTRGHGAMGQVLGVVCHHTAGSAKGLYPSENVVVNGRTGLAGPLCNLGLDRAGTWIIVAAGQGWHAGTGGVSWCPNNGNARLIGVEAESVGNRDDWTPVQRANYPRGVAALLAHLRLGSYRAIGHKEWAPGRKPDPAFWDMTQFRADVARWMSNPSTKTPPAQEDDDMTPDQAERLKRVERGLELVLQQLLGPGATIAEPFPGEARGGGWETWRYGPNGKRRFTLVDYFRALDREFNSPFSLANRPAHAEVEDSTVGHLLSTRATLLQVEALIRALSPSQKEI
jgi:hypothetical protein